MNNIKKYKIVYYNPRINKIKTREVFAYNEEQAKRLLKKALAVYDGLDLKIEIVKIFEERKEDNHDNANS